MFGARRRGSLMEESGGTGPPEYVLKIGQVMKKKIRESHPFWVGVSGPGNRVK